MKASNKCLDLIKHFEGLRTEAYLCPAGVPTIGYGHTLGVMMGDKISTAEAERLLRSDVDLCATDLRRLLTAELTQSQFDALVDFAFNLGSGNIANSTLLRKVNNDPSDPTIAEEFARWKYSSGIVLEGLVRRRAAESELYFSA